MEGLTMNTLIKNNKDEVKKVEEETIDKVIYSPQTDIYEDKESIYVVMNVPGVSDDNVDLSMEDGILKVTAVQSRFELTDYKKISSSDPEGTFKRSFKIEDDVDIDNISAIIKDGVLQITLPKAEEAIPKKIEVKKG
jgi:HSP20 family protein